MVDYFESLSAYQVVVGVHDQHNVLGVAVLADEVTVVGQRADVLVSVEVFYAVVDSRSILPQELQHPIDFLPRRVVVHIYQVVVRVVLPLQTFEQLLVPPVGEHFVPCRMDANRSLRLVIAKLVLVVKKMVFCFSQLFTQRVPYEQTA